MNVENISREAWIKCAIKQMNHTYGIEPYVDERGRLVYVDGEGGYTFFVTIEEALSAQAELDREEHITDAEVEAVKLVLEKYGIGYHYHKNLPKELAEAARKAKRDE